MARIDYQTLLDNALKSIVKDAAQHHIVPIVRHLPMVSGLRPSSSMKTKY